MARWKNINGVLQKIAGSVRIDQVLNKLSRNAISNKAVSEKFETVDGTLDTHQDAIDGINTHLSSLTDVKVANFVQGTSAPQGARGVPNDVVPKNADVIGISGSPAYDYFKHYKDSGGNIVVIQYDASNDTRDITGGINVNIYYVERN